MSKLSDKLSGLTYVPKPQSPQKAGMIQAFAGSVAPQGWHLCDGSVLEQADYPALFANIGSTWDTFAHPVDGTPTVGAGQFALPNLKGLYLAGSGDSGGDARTLGTFQDDKTAPNGISTVSDGSHTHGITRYESAGTALYQPSAKVLKDNVPSGDWGFTTAGGAHTHTINGDNETRPKTAPITYIIKLYDDTAGTSLSQVPASASARGVIQLSSEFAAGNGAYGLVEANDITKPADGDYTSGNINIVLNNNQVTVSSDSTLPHASLNSASTSIGFVPEWARPMVGKRVIYETGGAGIGKLTVDTSGTITTSYRNYSGTPTAFGAALAPFTITYDLK